LAITGGLYLGAGIIGLAVPFTTHNISPIWPASGVALACLLLFGWRCWPAITVAAFLVNYFSPLAPLAALGLATGNTLAALAGVFLLHRIRDFDLSLSRLRDMLGLFVFAAALSSTIGASIGSVVFGLLGIAPWATLGPIWLVYYLGDAMGILLAAPLLLTLRDWPRLRSPGRILELGGLLLLLAVTCTLLFDNRLHFAAHYTVLAMLVVPFVLWGAIRFGVAGAALANGVIFALAAIETAHGFGPFSQSTPLTNTLLLQLFFATVAISGLLLAAVIAERQSMEIERTTLIREQNRTERRRIELELQDSQANIASLIESTTDIIWSVDREGHLLSFNTALLEHFRKNYGTQPRLGGTSKDHLPPARAARWRSLYERAMAEGPFLEEYDLPDGRIFEMALHPMLRDKEVIGVSVFGKDITQRKRAEAELRASEAKLQAVFESSRDAIGVAKKGIHIFANPAYLELFGFENNEQIRGTSIIDSIAPSSRPQIMLNVQRRADGEPVPKFYEARGRKVDGAEFDAEFSVSTYELGGEIYSLATIRDITERKRTEEALRQLHRALRVLSHCNSAVVNATGEQALLDEVCRVAVERAN
jgi:PAS domain S-box-containing protein